MISPWAPLFFEQTNGSAPIVLICEHASPDMPMEIADLGLNEASKLSHAAWDIGALNLAKQLSKELDAPLVSCGVSRMLYDCNRPPSAPDAIPAKSELISIPGNENLTEAQRLKRKHLIHDPFHAGVAALIAAQRAKVEVPLTVVTVHTFTPTYYGKPRELELGFLHNENPALSLALTEVEQGRGAYKAALNEPYAATDGVTYTVAKHADAHQYHSTMIEVRNDLVDTQAKAQTVGTHLAQSLSSAIAQVTKAAGATS